MYSMQELSGRELDEITAFLAVAETGAFARAGKRLARDPSVLSRRVSSLEKRLAVRLIERTTRTLALTEAGLRFAERARAALAGLAEAESEARETAQAVSGTLRIALPNAFGRLWIAPCLPDFLRQYPNIRLEADFSDRFVDLVAENFDLAVRIGALPDSSLIARKIGASQRLLCAAPAYLAAHGPITAPTDLMRHNCLQFTRLATYPEWQFLRQEEKRETVKLKVSGTVATDEIELLIHAAIAGIGVTLCSEWVAAPRLASGALVRVLPGWHVGEGEAIYLLRPSSRHVPAKVRVFSDWLAGQLTPPPWLALSRPRPTPAAGTGAPTAVTDPR